MRLAIWTNLAEHVSVGARIAADGEFYKIFPGRGLFVAVNGYEAAIPSSAASKVNYRADRGGMPDRVARGGRQATANACGGILQSRRP